jgi:hypothetical protein
VGGVDGVSLKEFHADYKNLLYKLWNRLSSGSYMPPPVKLVEILSRSFSKGACDGRKVPVLYAYLPADAKVLSARYCSV